MPRLPRLNIPNIPQHVIQRGNNRQACFFDDADHAFYLDKLKDYAKKYKVSVHAYVLMTNHVHLLLTPETATGVSQLMQALGRVYVLYINKTYNRTGTLWEGRFKSTLVDNELYFLRVSRYIELNPVRANMVADPAQYPWSSYQANALGKKIALITPHVMYMALGNDEKMRESAYMTLFQESLSDKLIEEITECTLKGWAIGNEQFKQQIEAQTNRRASSSGHGGDRKSEKYLSAVKSSTLTP